MFTTFFQAFFASLFNFIPDLENMDSFPIFEEDDSIEFDTPFNFNFSSKNKDINDQSNISNSSEPSENPLLPIDEEEDNYISNKFMKIKGEINAQNRQQNIKEKNPIFRVIYPMKDSFFKESNLLFAEEEEIFLGRKRGQKKRKRKENADNIRIKAKRAFFNNVIYKALNKLLKNIGSIQYFEKFPNKFTGDVNKKRNKCIVNMSLREIIVNEDLYKCENQKGFNQYLHNLNIVESEEIKANKEFKKILDKTFGELYENYINSDEFLIDEINRLKKEKMSNLYIERYKGFCKQLISFFLQ